MSLWYGFKCHWKWMAKKKMTGVYSNFPLLDETNVSSTSNNKIIPFWYILDTILYPLCRRQPTYYWLSSFSYPKCVALLINTKIGKKINIQQVLNFSKWIFYGQKICWNRFSFSPTHSLAVNRAEWRRTDKKCGRESKREREKLMKLTQIWE